MVETSPAPDVPLRLPFRVSGLSSRKPMRFDLRPDADMRKALAVYLGVTAVHGLRFAGEIGPLNRHDYALEATLTARIEQPCGVTLQPVVTEIEEMVSRRYVADLPEPDGEDMEMPSDETVDPLPDVIDAGLVAVEALVLAVPPFPRAPGATLDQATFAPPGSKPLGDGDLKPFAGLATILATAAKGGTDPA